MSYRIQVNEDTIKGVILKEVEYVRESLDLYAYHDQMSSYINTGQKIRVWLPTGNISDILDHSNPPILIGDAKKQLLKNGKPNTRLIHELYNKSRNLAQLQFVNDETVSICIYDKFKHLNTSNHSIEPNEWQIHTNEFKDTRETLREAFHHYYIVRS